jgi:hypothetical protein
MEREAHMILLRRPQLLATCALLLAALAGCQQDRQPSAAPATTTSTVAPTTTHPPVTAAERAWPAGVAKLRQRLDRVFFQSRVVLTHAKLREYIRTGPAGYRRPSRSITVLAMESPLRRTLRWLGLAQPNGSGGAGAPSQGPPSGPAMSAQSAAPWLQPPRRSATTPGTKGSAADRCGGLLREAANEARVTKTGPHPLAGAGCLTVGQPWSPSPSARPRAVTGATSQPQCT